MLSSDRSIVYPFALILGSLAKGELNVIVLRPNFQQTSNQSRTIIKHRPFRCPSKVRNVFKVRNNPSTFPPAVNATKAYIHLFKKRFEAAHSRKVGTVSGDPPQNLYSTIGKLRPFRYPAKIRNIIKGRNLPRPTGAYSWSAKL